jgi:uncharacterized protein involved in response to NO
MIPRRGYQLFFLAAGGFAALSLALWTLSLAGVAPPIAPSWHGHEMAFGYMTAVLAGFLLAGGGGKRIGVLGALWLAGRLAPFAAGTALALPFAALDLLFLPALVLLRRPALWRGWKWPTIGFLPLGAVLTVANLLFHAGAAGLVAGGEALGLGLALDLYALMIAVMAGRLVPGYTRAMLIPVRTPRHAGLELGSVALLVGVALAALAGLDAVAGALALAAGVLQAARLAGWRTIDVLRRPLLLVLHLGYLWFALALLLRGTAALFGWPAPSEALHAFTVGAIGMLTLGMMTRLARVHARRKLAAGAFTAGGYALLLLAALVRVFGPVALPEAAALAWQIAGLLWVAAFALFLAEHARMLTAPHPSAAERRA